MKTTKLRWGIVGGGRIVNWFLEDFNLAKHRNQMELVAIFNRTTSKAQALAQKYHIPHLCQTFLELLTRDDIDIIYIGTNHATHFEFAQEALRRGIAVYCEKPIVYNYEKAVILYDLAKKHQTLFVDGIKTGVVPAFRSMSKDISAGIIGEIDYVYAPYTKMSTSMTVPNPEPGTESGGMLYGAGVYPVFIIHYLLGSPQKTVALNFTYPRNQDVERAYISCEYPNQKVGIVALSDRTNGGLQAEIQGSKGYIKLAGKLLEYNQAYHLDILHCPYTYQVFNLKNELIKEVDLAFETQGEGLKFLIDHCYDLMFEGKIASDVITPQISLDIIKTLNQIQVVKQYD